MSRLDMSSQAPATPQERPYFHIHVDGTEIGKPMLDFLKNELGFYEDNFDTGYRNPIAPVLH